MHIMPPRRLPRLPDPLQPIGSHRRKKPFDELPDLQDKQVDFHAVFDHSFEPQVIVDKGGRILAANRAICRLAGFSGVELNYLSLTDLFSAQDRPLVHEIQKKTRRRGRNPAAALALRSKHGTRKSVELQLTPLGANQWLATIRELSSVDSRTAHLQWTLDHYAELAELCGIAVISVDSGGRICNWNSAAERMFGYSISEAVGMPVVRLIPNRLRDRHEKGLNRRLKKPQPGAVYGVRTSDALRRDGTELPIELYVSVKGRGKSAVATAIVRDRTEKNVTDNRLHGALQQLEFHIQHAPLAYGVWDRELRVVEWNPAA